MKTTTLIFALAGILLIPMQLSATDVDAPLDKGYASFGIDAPAGEIDYTIITNDIGNLNSAVIVRKNNGNEVLDLDIDAQFGSAAGEESASSSVLNQIAKKPQKYQLVVTGDSGEARGSLKKVGASFKPE